MLRVAGDHGAGSGYDVKKRVFITEVDSFVGRHLYAYFTAGTRRNEYIVQGTLSERGSDANFDGEYNPVIVDERGFPASTESLNRHKVHARRASPGDLAATIRQSYVYNPHTPECALGAAPDAPTQLFFEQEFPYLFRLVPHHLDNLALFNAAIIESDIVVAVLNRNIHQGEVAIRLLSTTQYEREKTFVLVSSVLTWTNSRLTLLKVRQLEKLKRVVIFRTLLRREVNLRLQREAERQKKLRATPLMGSGVDEEITTARSRDFRRSASISDDSNGDLEGGYDDQERVSDDEDGEEQDSVSNGSRSTTAHGRFGSGKATTNEEEDIAQYIALTRKRDLLPATFAELEGILGLTQQPSFPQGGDLTEANPERFLSEYFCRDNGYGTTDDETERAEVDDGDPNDADEVLLRDMRDLGLPLGRSMGTDVDVARALHLLRRLEADWLERGDTGGWDDELESDYGSEAGDRPDSVAAASESMEVPDATKVWTEEEYHQRVPHERYARWKWLEQLTKKRNSQTLHTYVVFRGLPYGEGEEEGGVLQHLCRAALCGSPLPDVFAQCEARQALPYVDFLGLLRPKKPSPQPRHHRDDASGEDLESPEVGVKAVDFDMKALQRQEVERRQEEARAFRERFIAFVDAQATSRPDCNATPASLERLRDQSSPSTALSGLIRLRDVSWRHLDNYVPMIHVTDLARVVFQLATSYETLESRYFVAVDRGAVTLRCLLRTIYQQFGVLNAPVVSGNCPTAVSGPRSGFNSAAVRHSLLAALSSTCACNLVTPFHQLPGSDYLMCNLRFEPGLALELVDGATGGNRRDEAGDAEGESEAGAGNVFGNLEDDAPGAEGVQADVDGPLRRILFDDEEGEQPRWLSYKGFVVNSGRIARQQFVERHRLRPLRIVIIGPPCVGKSALTREIAQRYYLPALSLESIVSLYEDYASLLEMRLRMLRREWEGECAVMLQRIQQATFMPPLVTSGATDHVSQSQRGNDASDNDNGIGFGQMQAEDVSLLSMQLSGGEAAVHPEWQDDNHTAQGAGEPLLPHTDDQAADVFRKWCSEGVPRAFWEVAWSLLSTQPPVGLSGSKTEAGLVEHSASGSSGSTRVSNDSAVLDTASSGGGVTLPFEDHGLSSEERRERQLQRQLQIVKYYRALRILYVRKATRLAMELKMARLVLSLKRGKVGRAGSTDVQRAGAAEDYRRFGGDAGEGSRVRPSADATISPDVLRGDSSERSEGSDHDDDGGGGSDDSVEDDSEAAADAYGDGQRGESGSEGGDVEDEEVTEADVYGGYTSTQTGAVLGSQRADGALPAGTQIGRGDGGADPSGTSQGARPVLPQPLRTHPTSLYADEALAVMVRWRLRQKDCRRYGFVLDGFPNTVRQAWLVFRNGAFAPEEAEGESVDEEASESDPDEEAADASTSDGGIHRSGHRGRRAKLAKQLGFDGFSIVRTIDGDRKDGDKLDALRSAVRQLEERYQGVPEADSDEEEEQVKAGRVARTIAEDELFISHPHSMVRSYFPGFPAFHFGGVAELGDLGSAEGPINGPRGWPEKFLRTSRQLDLFLGSVLPAKYGIDKDYIEADFNEEESVDPDSFLTPTDPLTFPDCTAVLHASDVAILTEARKRIQEVVAEQRRLFAESQRQCGATCSGEAEPTVADMEQAEKVFQEMEDTLLRNAEGQLERFHENHAEGAPYTRSLITWFQSCRTAEPRATPYFDSYAEAAARGDSADVNPQGWRDGEAAEYVVVGESSDGAGDEATDANTKVTASRMAAVSFFPALQRSQWKTAEAELVYLLSNVEEKLIAPILPHPMTYSPPGGWETAVDLEAVPPPPANFANPPAAFAGPRSSSLPVKSDAAADAEMAQRRAAWQRETYGCEVERSYVIPCTTVAASSVNGSVSEGRSAHFQGKAYADPPCRSPPLPKRSIDGGMAAPVADASEAESEATTTTAGSSEDLSEYIERRKKVISEKAERAAAENREIWRRLEREALEAQAELQRAAIASRKVCVKTGMHVDCTQAALPSPPLTTQEYLMSFVLPALAAHIPTVVRTKPDDPQDALANLLYDCNGVRRTV